MLNNDSGDVLLLAHGYMDLQTLTDLKLAEWLDRRKERRIDLLVGLHDRGEVGCTSENPMRVEKTFEKLLRTWNLPSDARNRLELTRFDGHLMVKSRRSPDESQPQPQAAVSGAIS